MIIVMSSDSNHPILLLLFVKRLRFVFAKMTGEDKIKERKRRIFGRFYHTHSAYTHGRMVIILLHLFVSSSKFEVDSQNFVRSCIIRYMNTQFCHTKKLSNFWYWFWFRFLSDPKFQLLHDVCEIYKSSSRFHFTATLSALFAYLWQAKWIVYTVLSYWNSIWISIIVVCYKIQCIWMNECVWCVYLWANECNNNFCM